MTGTPDSKFRRLRNLTAGAAVALLMATAALASCSSTQPGDAQADPAHQRSASVAEDMPEDASSAELIAAALAAGEIDEPTSLLYRLWAELDDPTLPEQYRGAPAPHDIALFPALNDALDDMPEGVAEQVAPYLKRPSDPASAFSADGGDAPGLRAPGSATLPQTSVLTTDSETEPQQCAAGWSSQAERVDDPVFRAWVCRDIGDDEAVDAALTTLVQIVEQHSGELVADMGRPVADHPDADASRTADELIDIYLLPSGWLGTDRDSGVYQLGDRDRGLAVPTPPFPGEGSSGYILLRASLIEDPDLLANVLVHEMFHVLQFAHRYHNLSSRWFYEATAAWAANHYAPFDPAASTNNRVRYLQTSPVSVHADGTLLHSYSASIWALFMEQQVGAQSIFAAWQALATAPPASGGAAVVEAIGAQIDIAAQFPAFVLRLLNADLPGDPVSPRFAELDPTIPDGTLPEVEPVVIGDGAIGNGAIEIDVAGIPGLGYRFAHLQAQTDGSAPPSLVVTGNLAIASGTAPVLQAVVEGADGTYVHEQVAVDSDICIGGSDFWLMIANPSTVIDDEVSGSITLTPGRDAVGCGAPATETPSPPAAPSSPPASPSAPTDQSAASCDESAGWDTKPEASTIGLNAPITAITGRATDCYDTITVTLDDSAGNSGYRVEYVPQVSAQGTGDAVPLAGSHALEVIIDSPAYDPATMQPTVQLGENIVDVAGFGVVRQVASGGSFEGMTTLGIGVDGRRPFAAEANPHALIIKIARNDGSATTGSATPSAGTPAPAACTALQELSLHAGRYADLALLPFTADEVRSDFNSFEPYLDQFPDELTRQIQVLRMAAIEAAGKPAADAADILDDSQVRAASDYIAKLYGASC